MNLKPPQEAALTKHILHELTRFVYEYLQDTFQPPEYPATFPRRVALLANIKGLAEFQIGCQGGDDDCAGLVENFYGDGGNAASGAHDACAGG